MTIALPRLDRTTSADRGLTIVDFFIPIRVGERLNSRVRDVALVVAGAFFIYLTARVSIPIPGTPIPMTGQTFGVLLVGGALGLRRGLAAVSLYVLLGVIGLPFFADGEGGISVILGASGGFLIGFIAGGNAGWVFGAFAVPFLIYGLIRIRVKESIITVFGRRSKARIRFTLRRARAQRLYEEICERVRAAQEVPHDVDQDSSVREG